MAGAASAHQAATASREGNCQQRAGRTRRTSADPQRAQPGATAAAAAEPGALDSLSRLQQLADSSPQVAQLRRLQALANGRFAPVAQLAGVTEEEELVQGKFATTQLQPQLQQAPRANNTSLPDQLKSGIESLSGLSMDHVRVHYNSSQPAQLNALAYAQGSDIHLAPGQERHLPHEAWHVVQQAQGRVRPTLQMKEGVQVNDDAGLEREADVMGAKAPLMPRLALRTEGEPHQGDASLHGVPKVRGEAEGAGTYITGADRNVHLNFLSIAQAALSHEPDLHLGGLDAVHEVHHRPDAVAESLGKSQAVSAPTPLPVQRYLKVGPIEVNKKHVEFIYEKVFQAARDIQRLYQGATILQKNSPTWIAYKKRIPLELMNRKEEVKAIITRWAESSGVGLPTIKESVKEKLTGVRGEKAEWKEFSDYLELALAIGYELDSDLQSNRKSEINLGKEIMQNTEIARKLDTMRLKLMQWIANQYNEHGESLKFFKAKFRIGGSYNFSSQSKVNRDFDALLGVNKLSVMDNIEILHDLMELTSDAGAGSVLQNFGMVLAPEVRESAYHQIAVDEKNEIYEVRPMKTKSDHGQGGHHWKAARHYTLKEFEVEFQAFENRIKDKDPDGVKMNKLGNPNDMNVLDSKSEKRNTRYRGKRVEKLTKAQNYQRKPPSTLLEKISDTFLTALNLKSNFKPSGQDSLHKRSKGRHNVGTRDEYDPVTVLARAHNVPIEAGRSMTTARLLELCTKALKDDRNGSELHKKGESELDAVAQGIFAYWAAQYNQALTPIHTYHEVMDVARQYNVEYKPFHYKYLKSNTMEAKSLVPMDRDFSFEIVPKAKLREERREQPYRITDSQRDKLTKLHRKAVWIDPNGDCLYNALSAVGARIGNVRNFRIILADFLEKNEKVYQGYIAGADGKDAKEVALQISTPGSYYNLGGDMTPLLIADSLEMPFTIMNENGSYHHIKGGDMNKLIIRVTNPLPHFHGTKSTATDIELPDYP